MLVLFPVVPPSVVMVSVVVMAVVGTMLSFAVVAELELSVTAVVVVVVVVVVVADCCIVADEDSGLEFPDALSGVLFLAGLNSIVAWFM